MENKHILGQTSTKYEKLGQTSTSYNVLRINPKRNHRSVFGIFCTKENAPPTQPNQHLSQLELVIVSFGTKPPIILATGEMWAAAF